MNQKNPHLAATDRSERATEQEIRAVFFGLMIVLGLGALDQSIVATALPRIVGELGGVTRLTWIVTAYVLSSTSVMPLYGKLSDQHGRKPMLYVAVMTFLVGSALSGAARSLTELIIFRAIQGLGAGGLLPLSQTIIADIVPPAERGRRQGMIAAVFAACSVFGPVLGGLITDLLSWHWIFYVNLPIGAVALVVIAKALKRPNAIRAHRIDYLGAFVLTVCTAAFLMILTLGGVEWPWDSPPLLALAAATSLALFLLVIHLRRVAEPVLPLDLFRNRTFVVASLTMALTFMGLLGASVFFPLFFQVVMGVSAAHSGFLTGPLMVGVVISSFINGRLLQRTGRYKAAQLAGLSLAVLAFALLAWGAATARDFYVIEPCIFSLGLGLGFVMPNMTIAVQNTLSAAHRGVGTATLAFFRSLGGLVGVTGSGAILAWKLRDVVDHGTAHAVNIDLYRHAIALTFSAGVGIVLAALVVLLFLPEVPLRGHGAAMEKKSET